MTDRPDIPAHSSVIVCIGDNYRADCLTPGCGWTSYAFTDKDRAREWGEQHQADNLPAAAFATPPTDLDD